MRTSTDFDHLASFQAIEFVDQPVPEALDIFVHVCQTSEDKAFFTKGSFLALYTKREAEREHKLISSPVSTLSTRSPLHYDGLNWVQRIHCEIRLRGDE